MAVVIWRPQTVLGPVAMAFPPSVAKAAGIARAKAPIRTGELRRSVRHQILAGFHGAIVANAKHAAAQEYGAKPHQIGADGQFLASKAPRRTTGKYQLLGKRTTRQNFFARGPVNHPGNKGLGFVRLGAQAWKALYVLELRKKLGRF